MSVIGRGVRKTQRVAYRIARTRGELLRIGADPDPRVRAVGRAIGDALDRSVGPAEEAWIQRIESLRGRLLESREVIDPSRDETVGGLCRTASKPPLWTLLLFELVRHLRPSFCLELGTCLGISAGY